MRDQYKMISLSHILMVLKLDGIVVVTRYNLKEIVLGKLQDAVIKYLMSLPPDTSWNDVNDVFW